MPRLLPLLCAVSAACSTLAPRPRPPVASAASLAFAEARALARAGDGAAALESASAAAALAPRWIAPRRFLDDHARGELRAAEAVRRYRERLERDPEDAAALYLVGRLEGLSGDHRLRRAARLDPRRAWVWHGLGWNAHRRGENDAARRHARRALNLARDPFERAYFTWAWARIALREGREDEAVALLLDRLTDTDLEPVDRTWLQAVLARVELDSGDPERRRRGAHRGLELLERAELTDAEVRELVEGVSLWGHLDPGRAALHLALAGRGAIRERGRLIAFEGASALALALREGSTRGLDRELRDLHFAVGDPGGEVTAWIASLPAFLRTGGSPHDPRLARLASAAEELGPPGAWTPEATAAFGRALLEAGWFEEARAFAARVPAGDLEAALELDVRARAGRGVVRELRRLGNGADHGGVRRVPLLGAGGEAVEESLHVEDLDDLLAALAPTLARAMPHLGVAERSVEEWSERLVASPRIDYRPLGEVVRPGPTRNGERLDGLAAVLDRIGRFGLFGEGLGQPPDGVLLRRLWIEERRGRHLGVDWSGSVAWCEGADLPPRAGRAGARIAGAALHEGYWIDVEVLREEQRRWAHLAARFEGELDAVLAVAPLAVGEGEDRAGTDLLLGAADRLRLAITRDRGVPVSVEELCEVTAAHEEGHLCDRERFLPLSENWWAVLGLFARAGFSPGRLAELLEERAQIVALCVVRDPRVPLTQVLQAAEDGGAGTTPHGPAYARLCGRFLEEWSRRVDEHPARWSHLDPGAFLGQQAHLLSPEEVRRVALGLARRDGLVRER